MNLYRTATLQAIGLGPIRSPSPTSLLVSQCFEEQFWSEYATLVSEPVSLIDNSLSNLMFVLFNF